ncbi:hypothetical protein M011DRAFT_395104 [Sporormia fimetaria CBS 119925]|uniref:BHLH domain-containing protein n=1 Tax=Sporormia fimetaria CBS 119925 TaxID=1340428 RepID=A0A6A6VP03_9PLEO|nr:hypothetical protein M011DRAFT_395104 [Sporormia fimetaria CBS 119925]
MALNWNAFLTDDSLTLPDEQWSDFPSTSIDPLSQMPKPTSGRKHDLSAGGFTAFDPVYNPETFGDTLFNPNDYFLSDLEVLQPFGDKLAGEETSESSPEPTSGVSLSGPFSRTDISSASQTPVSTSTGQDLSPQMRTLPRPNAQRAQTFPNPNYEAMFPNNMDASFVEDLTFPIGPSVAGRSSKSGPAEEQANTETTTKRNKAKPDILSACWTSPLCPNHDQDGPPPNPSSCGGGCAPFLFADDALQANMNSMSMVPEPQEVVAEDGVVEIQPRPKKRSESTSSSEPTGRQFPTHTPANKDSRSSRVKSETVSEDSPQQATPPTEDPKPKTRRRLPHNQVERKYRESLNTQLESLRRVVPALQQNARGCDGADIEDLPAPSKPSKAVILASATAYIKQMEKENKAVQDENQLLRARVKALQALVKCEDCSLMQYVMDLKINGNNPAAACAHAVK